MTNKLAYPGRIIFDHMPKTAGQAVNAWLMKELGSGCVTENLIGEHRDLIRSYGGSHSVISGHVHFLDPGLDPRYRYMTCLREPLDRALSWLFFVIKNHKQEQLPELWEAVHRFIGIDDEKLPSILKGHVNNPYVEHFSRILNTVSPSDEKKLSNALAAIELYDVWGLYEEMPAFLADASALIGIASPAAIERVNVTLSRPTVEHATPSLLNRLKDLNSLDIEFYRILRERWKNKPSDASNFSASSVTTWQPYNAAQAVKPVQKNEFSLPGFILISARREGGSKLTHGQLINLAVEFSLDFKVSDLSLVFHVLDKNASWVFGADINLLTAPLSQVLPGCHKFRYQFVADLPPGQYDIGFSFSDRNAGVKRELARYDKLLSFAVIASDNASAPGSVNLPTRFEYQQTSDSPVKLIENASGFIRVNGVLGTLQAGEFFNLPIQLGNTSNQPWVSTQYNPINFSYSWLDESGNVIVPGGDRTPLPVDRVLPLQTISSTMRVTAPLAAGRYTLLLVPVQEMQFWFNEKGFTPTAIELGIVMAGDLQYFPAADIRLLSKVGQRDGTDLVSTGKAGLLLYGPYAKLPAGRYVARFYGHCEADAKGGWVDACFGKGGTVLTKIELGDSFKPGVIAELPFEIAKPVDDLEVRLWMPAKATVRVESLSIEPYIEAKPSAVEALTSNPVAAKTEPKKPKKTKAH
jgi:hypothetical protein